jgi:SP family general alpha glucoside:H+ symporter-like MFS transporter
LFRQRPRNRLNLSFPQFTVGPVCYCLVGEIPSTRLRAKSVAFSRIMYNIASIINNILLPRMLTASAVGGWGWGKKTGYFMVGLNVLNLLYIFFRLPETKGRSFAEINVLFETNVSARKFSKTDVNLFDKSRAATGDIMDDQTAAAKAEKTYVS